MSSLSDEALIEVSTKGAVADQVQATARAKFHGLARLVREPVQGTEIRLIHELRR